MRNLRIATPLAAIHGYAELYKMQRDMPGALERADESIEHIEASSARMTVLVEDLLGLWLVWTKDVASTSRSR